MCAKLTFVLLICSFFGSFSSEEHENQVCRGKNHTCTPVFAHNSFPCVSLSTTPRIKHTTVINITDGIIDDPENYCTCSPSSSDKSFGFDDQERFKNCTLVEFSPQECRICMYNNKTGGIVRMNALHFPECHQSKFCSECLNKLTTCPVCRKKRAVVKLHIPSNQKMGATIPEHMLFQMTCIVFVFVFVLLFCTAARK